MKPSNFLQIVSPSEDVKKISYLGYYLRKYGILGLLGIKWLCYVWSGFWFSTCTGCVYIALIFFLRFFLVKSQECSSGFQNVTNFLFIFCSEVPFRWLFPKRSKSRAIILVKSYNFRSRLSHLTIFFDFFQLGSSIVYIYPKIFLVKSQSASLDSVI